ncbi:GNAT family protein [Brevibacterium sp. BRM-1]|uniref:GNAT family N-acetyltransferase n=1 Tax=Brevibacterium sp. BRM-1 TaxID=2999062 RepID=UPI00227EAFCA|nr:GNAT family protein [Brevibacterium sp. BRM-1]WAL40135.1 GNAT family protein [Brevibacterium sp. BRM-1]
METNPTDTAHTNPQAAAGARGDAFDGSSRPGAGDPAAFAAAPDLVGERVTLAQLSPAHTEGLGRASEGIDLWVTSVPSAGEMDAEIERRLGLQRAGSMAPYTVLDRGEPVGMTTFMNIDAANRHVEIGSTWLSPAVRGTRVNPEAKLLLLTRAFEDLDAIAVEFRTHWHNHQSRGAIAKLGAKQDGVLRNHQFFAGALRDTVVFSITRAEWPTVKLGLTERLKRLD